jgi:ribosome-binding factor A
MPGYRIGRINDDIKQELSAMLPTLKDPRVRGIISITRVDTTADLRYCKVYISALDRENLDQVIKGLKSASGYLRRELGHRMSLRYTPELQFIADDSIDRGTKLIKMMEELHTKEE